MAEQEARRRDPRRDKHKEKDKEAFSRSNGNHEKDSRKDTEKDTEALRAKEREQENDGRGGSKEKGPPVGRKRRIMNPNHGHRRASPRPLTGTSTEQTRTGDAKCSCRQVGCVERCRQTLPAALAASMCAKGAGGMANAGTVRSPGIRTIRSITVVTVSSRMAGAHCPCP